MIEKRIDVRGLFCPLPVLEAGKVAVGMRKGERLIIEGDDPMMEIDFPLWCHREGHRLVSLHSNGSGFRVEVEIEGVEQGSGRESNSGRRLNN